MQNSRIWAENPILYLLTKSDSLKVSMHLLNANGSERIRCFCGLKDLTLFNFLCSNLTRTKKFTDVVYEGPNWKPTVQNWPICGTRGVFAQQWSSRPYQLNWEGVKNRFKRINIRLMKIKIWRAIAMSFKAH